MDSPHQKISVILPTFNEKDNIDHVIRGIAMQLKSIPFEIIIVDDNSPDGTANQADLLAKQFPVRVIRRKRKLGLASAVMHGFKEAGGEILVSMDADGQHDPSALGEMVTAMTSGADIVIGTRIRSQTDASWGALRRLVSGSATLMARLLTHVTDPMSGFFALRKKVLTPVSKWSLVGYKILLEILVRTGAKNVVEIPIVFHARKHGKTKLNFTEMLRYIYLISSLLLTKTHPETRAARTGSFVKYCLVAVLGLIIDVGLLALLVERSGINPETSPLLYVFVSISFIAAVLNNYFFNVRWAFNVSGGKHLARFSRFFLVSVIGLVLSNIFMFLFVSLAGIWYLFAKVITTAIVILWNYSVNAMWVFKK